MSNAHISHLRRGHSKIRNPSSVLLMAVLSVFITGCGSMPAHNSVVTVQVWEVFGKADNNTRQLKPSEFARLRDMGVSDEDIAAGRIVGVHCAVMSDGWWNGLAILPTGLLATKGTTLRVKVIDPGDNERLGVNEFVGLPPQLPRGGQAYRFVPNWRELGRENNYERVELPAEHRDKYLVVQGSYLIKCAP